MPPQIRPLIVGLASPGLFWLATSVAFGQDAPAPQGPPTSAPTSPATYRALLLSSGKVVRGEIIDVPVAKAFCLKGSGGPVPYPKNMVLKAAGSVEELYQFQVARLPEGDTFERVKLAKWCLTEKLIPQAREQLEAVERLSPGDREVERMLYNLAASERPAVDSEVRRTSADVPADLDPRVIQGKRHYNGLPQIFDLPAAQAVKRANEFAQYVQPVLQQNCVKCHNEKYQGSFQLVEAKNRHEQNNTDILRANLDATLRLVNPDDPSRSELLSAGLVPHGGYRNAIFKGPNDPGYAILVTWIKRVRPPANGPGGMANPNALAARPGFNSSNPEPMGNDGFATDRSGRPAGTPGFPASNGGAEASFAGRPGGAVGPGTMIPQSGSTISNYDESAEFVRSPGDNPQFPPPFVVGGAPVPSATPPRSRPLPKNPGDANPPPPLPPTPSTQTAKPIGPNAVAVPPAENFKQLPGMDKPLYPTGSSKADDDDPNAPPPPPAAKKKPKPMNKALLDQVIKSRNGGASTGSP